MTPQKLWVLKAHTKTKKETKEKRTRHTNKQAIKQISKRANKETTKTNKPSRLFFFWSDAMAGAIACGQTKQIKKNNKQAITWASTKSWTLHLETGLAPKETTKTNKPSRLFFFLARRNGWSHCVWSNETTQKTISKQSREPTQNHECYM